LDLSYYVPQVKISIASINESELEQSIDTVTLTEGLSSSSKISFTLMDELVNKKFKWLDSIDFEDDVKVQLGYVGNTKPVFEGKITGIQTGGFSSNGSVSITIEGFDNSLKILPDYVDPDIETASEKPTGTDLAKMIATKSGLKFHGDTATEPEMTIPQRTTYDSVLGERKSKIGFEYFVSRGTFYYIDPRAQKSSGIEYTWGKDLISFSPSINTASLYASVDVISTPATKKETISGTAKTGSEKTMESGVITASQTAKKIFGNKTNTMSNENYESEGQCNERALAELHAIGENFLTCSVTVVGTLDVEVGKVVKLVDLGTKLSGLYFVTTVTNSISSSGYTTSFTARRNYLGN